MTAELPRCEATRSNGSACKRRAQWGGLCFQHWRIRELAARRQTAPTRQAAPADGPSAAIRVASTNRGTA